MRALLCTHHLLHWSGSETVVIELAEALINKGFDVDFYAPFHVPSFVEAELPVGSRFLTSPDEVLIVGYDLVYVQHQTLSRIVPLQPEEALIGQGRPLFVYNHLSRFEPFELPGPFVEVDLADVIWVQSLRTKDEFRLRFQPRFAWTDCVPNPAPHGFERPTVNARQQLLKLLVVSNHLPDELRDAIGILSASGVEVTQIGLPDENRRLRPSDVHSADAVVTIGKTVQYALRARVPVFCYDHFGGPGWLGPDTFAPTAHDNFSGRNSPDRQSAADIVHHLLDGYAAAAAFAVEMPSAHLEQFRLEAYVSRLINQVNAHRRDPRPVAANRRGVPFDLKAGRLRWAHEADLCALIDREYGAALRLQAHVGELGRELRALRRLKGVLS